MEKKILKTTIGITLLGILTKLVGFIKQMVIANYYGANGKTDAFFLASGFIGDTSYLICTTLSITFLTMYIMSKNTENKERRNQFVSSVTMIFVGIACLISIIIWLFAPQISRFLAFGYSSNELSVVIYYMRIFSFVIMLQVVITIHGTVLNAEKHFIPYQMMGGIQSIVIIIFIVCFYDYLNIYALIISFVVAYICQMIFLLIFSKKYVKLRFVNPFKDNRVKELLKLICPLLIGYGVIQINQIVDKMVTTNLGEGVLSALSYSQTLNSSISQLFIASIGTVLFSYFSDYVSNGNEEEIKKVLSQSFVMILMILLPITVFLVVDAQEIVQAIYGRGNFTQTAVNDTALAQIGYSLGLCFLGVRELLVRVHYAYQDTKRPTVNSIIAVLINIALSILLSKYIGILGVTLASSISMVVSSILLSITLRKHIKDLRKAIDIKKLLKVFIASSGLFLFCVLLEKVNFNTYLELIVLFGGGSIVYIMLLYFLKIEEVNIAFEKIKKRIKYLRHD